MTTPTAPSPSSSVDAEVCDDPQYCPREHVVVPPEHLTDDFTYLHAPTENEHEGTPS